LAEYPLVSVCIPAYNIEKYFEATIECVLNQSYKSIEIIIVDDGSTDKTGQIAGSYINDNIRLLHQKNKGASAARNLAYQQSKGEYIKFLDGDDLMDTGMIESQVNLALQNHNCIISAQWGRFYNDDVSTFKLSPEECWQTLPPVAWLCASWKYGASMTQPGIFLIPRNLIEKAGLWDEQLTLIDDLEFFTRVVLKSDKVVFDSQSILYYRSGISGSLSDQKAVTAIKSAFKSIDQSTCYLQNADQSAYVLSACANMWQQFIYEVYPREPELIAFAKDRVVELNGSSLEFKCGGITKIMVSIIGWKLTKRFKSLFTR
jgi:glycosyltransferase involved in cell wall biosynthesis